MAAELTVVANTADDVEVYGVHVSPDPDLVTYWLADAIDERGWGLRDDTWKVMEALEATGAPHWFRLGDRDLASCLVRTERLRAGASLTEAQAAVTAALGARARVLPMSDEPVTTWVGARGRTLPFQEFMIVEHAEGPVESVELRGLDVARPSAGGARRDRGGRRDRHRPLQPGHLDRPDPGVAGHRGRSRDAAAPVVAVSPFVGGRTLKGPTDDFCRFAGIETNAAGIAAAYGDVLDGIVADEQVAGIDVPRHRHADGQPEQRLALATNTLDFAAKLAG